MIKCWSWSNRPPPRDPIVRVPDAGNQWYTNADDGSARYEDYIVTDLQAEDLGRALADRHGA